MLHNPIVFQSTMKSQVYTLAILCVKLFKFLKCYIKSQGQSKLVNTLRETLVPIHTWKFNISNLESKDEQN